MLFHVAKLICNKRILFTETMIVKFDKVLVFANIKIMIDLINILKIEH